jgi:predicted flap endonuclease-1-like 5' DNA nuclease
MDANLVGLIVGVILAVVTIFLILWGNRPSPAKSAPVAAVKTAAAAPADVVKASPAAPAVPDDLVIIEGIGPKIAKLLNQNGVTTFAQLAGTDVAAIEKILRTNGLQFVKPGSWPEQARLAAAGKMDELKALQDKLVAGR